MQADKILWRVGLGTERSVSVSYRTINQTWDMDILVYSTLVKTIKANSQCAF